MSEQEPPPDTPAWWRNKTDEQLEEALRCGPIGNRSVDSAMAEINRRAGERQENWSKRGYWAALAAAGAAVAGAIITWLK